MLVKLWITLLIVRWWQFLECCRKLQDQSPTFTFPEKKDIGYHDKDDVILVVPLLKALGDTSNGLTI